MGRLACCDDRQPLSPPVADPEKMGRDVAGNPAAQGEDTQHAIRFDRLDDQSDFIQVGIQLDPDPVPPVAISADIDILQAVPFRLAKPPAIRNCQIRCLMLKSRRPGDLGIIGYHLNQILFVHVISPLCTRVLLRSFYPTPLFPAS